MSNVLTHLERRWRQLMTILCFTLFGVGGILLSLVWFNCLTLFYRDKKRRIYLARLSVSYSFRLFLFTAQTIGVLSYRVEGLERLQTDSGCLILANHPTLLDYVLIASVMPDIDCLVKSNLLHNPFVSGVIRATNYLTNDQHDILLAECKRRLGMGDNILIFPEGTRTTPGIAPQFQRGAANIALRCGCPIRLIHLSSSEDTLNKQSKWYQAPKNKVHLSLSVSNRFTINELIDKNLEPESIQVRRLTQKLETLFY